jgi:hypothetical protein
MGANVTLISGAKQAAAPAVLSLVFAALTTVMAVAQDAPPPRDEGFFAATGRWFDEQFSKFGSSFKDAGRKVETFGHEAGVAAKTTAEGAKDAADAVAKIPNTRPVSGHQTCRIAPNGAPDCVAAANSLCKSKGFGSGKSLDMTTAEVCPPKVYLSGRNTGPECTTETFVSRALCQ